MTGENMLEWKPAHLVGVGRCAKGGSKLTVVVSGLHRFGGVSTFYHKKSGNAPQKDVMIMRCRSAVVRRNLSCKSYRTMDA